MFFTLSPFKGKVSVQAGILPNREDLLVLQQTLSGEFAFAVAMPLEECHPHPGPGSDTGSSSSKNRYQDHKCLLEG